MLCSRICWEDNDSQRVTMPVETLKFGTMRRNKLRDVYGSVLVPLFIVLYRNLATSDIAIWCDYQAYFDLYLLKYFVISQ